MKSFLCAVVGLCIVPSADVTLPGQIPTDPVEDLKDIEKQHISKFKTNLYTYLTDL